MKQLLSLIFSLLLISSGTFALPTIESELITEAEEMQIAFEIEEYFSTNKEIKLHSQSAAFTPLKASLISFSVNQCETSNSKTALFLLHESIIQ